MLTISRSQDLQTGSLRNARQDVRLLLLEGMPTPEIRVPTAELLRFRRMPWPYTDPNDPDEPTPPFSSSLMLRSLPNELLVFAGHRTGTTAFTKRMPEAYRAAQQSARPKERGQKVRHLSRR